MTMEEMLKKLRIKYTLMTTLISGIFLLVLLGGFFGLLYTSTEVVAGRTMDAALSASNPNASATLGKRCIIFQLIGAVAHTNDEIDYYGDDAPQIINSAIDTGEGKFRVNDYYFRTTYKNNPDGTKTFAVYDRTADRESLLNTSFILAMLYVCAMALVALLAYLLSSRTLQPVEESFKKQRDLIANASHELKTPLTIISTNLSVIKSEPLSTIENNEKWISSIDSQISRMNGLIQNMLELSKLEQSVIPKESTNFSECTEGACLAFEAVCFEKGLSFVTDIKKDLYVFGDKSALERLVVILLDNATKYSGQNGKIGCKLTADNKKLHLFIMNTGETISNEDAKHIFDRFYRADGARSNTDNQSFGLGLAIAQATVSSHGGVIACKGIAEKGTIFEVTLPIEKKSQQISPHKNKMCGKNNSDENFDYNKNQSFERVEKLTFSEEEEMLDTLEDFNKFSSDTENTDGK